MIKGIIFDLDGVLVFTDEYHYLAWQKVFDKYQLFFDRNMNQKLRGVSRKESLEIVLSENKTSMDEVQKQKLLEEKNAIYIRFLEEKLTPEVIPQTTRDVLSSLREKGFKLAIGSSSKNTPLILKRTELLLYFDAISDGNMIQNSKPDPEVFLKAASLLHLSSQECVVVEDGEAGIIAAIRGGFTPLGIGNEISPSLSYHPISSLSDLLCFNF